MTETEQQDAKPPAEGPLANRPPAASVPAGSTYDATDTGDLWRSDGNEWWNANAERDPWHLAYGEDVQQGALIRRVAEVPTKDERSQQMRQLGPIVAVMTGGGCGHLHLPEWVIVMERREYGDLVAIIGVRPNGEQVPIYLSRAELVQVKNEDAPL